MKRYTGVIFDMDGVLFDTERVYQESWHEIADGMGVTLGDGWVEAISGTNGEVMCRAIEKFYHVPDGAEIMNACKGLVRDKLSRHVPVKAGVREILDFFRERNLRIALASSSTRAQILSNLALTGLGAAFDAIVSGEEVTVGKPDPEIFLRAAQALGCPPDECLVFEDSKSGVRAGHAAGCDTVMVPDLIAPSPDIVPLCFRIYGDMNAALADMRKLECVSKCREMQFRVDLAAFQGDFPQA